MLQETSTRAAVYQVLDQVLADGSVAPSSRAAMFSVIDRLRETSAPVADLRRAERISIEILKLESALRQGDAGASDGALHELKVLAASWLDSRICG